MMKCPHNEILRNLLTSKTGYVEIALRLGFGINLVFMNFVFLMEIKPLKATSIVNLEAGVEFHDQGMLNG
jgi:hypothetical protein